MHQNFYFPQVSSSFPYCFYSLGCDAQGQIDELKSTIEALESEKADMVLKLSEAKQQGVKAVREEEEKKRQELVEEMQKKRDEDRLEDERKLQEEVKKVVRY